MKKSLMLLVLIVSMVSCIQFQHIENYTVNDLSKYDGFFITPNSYYGQYEPIGIITLYVQSDRVKAEEVNGYLSFPHKNLPENIAKNYTNYPNEIITEETLTAMLVNKAKSLNADGITNIKISGVYDIFNNYKLHSGYRIEGFAIKRK